MSDKKTLLLTKAIAFIKEEIEHTRRQGRTFLPSLRTLEQRSGLSRSTLSNAVNQLRNEGFLVVRHGKGIALMGEDEKPQSIDRPAGRHESFTDRNKWKLIESQIERDILNGKYRAGTAIPPKKELQAKYNIAFQTLKKALDTLVERGTLKPQKSRYIVHTPSTAHHSQGKIVVIGESPQPGTIPMTFLQSREFYRTLSHEIPRFDLRMEIVGYHDSGDRPVFMLSGNQVIEELPSDDWVLGYIILTWNIRNPLELIHRVRAHGKPVSIWLEKADFTFPSRSKVNRLTRLFDISYSKDVGRAAAHHLLDLGHTSVAYLSPFHQSVWSQNREAGIREAFADAGYPTAVHSFTIDNYRSDWPYTLDARTKYDPKSFIDLQKLAAQFPPAFSRALKGIQNRIDRYCTDGEIFRRMEPLFEQALKATGCTAWITANDHCASFALDFLAERGIEVPAYLSVVGFDDSYESLERGVTTYNFNIPSLAHAMISHIVNPYDPRFPRNKKIITIEGTIVPHNSTGIPRTIVHT
jgi:DNA-binding GntR family transcriptional regulator